MSGCPSVLVLVLAHSVSGVLFPQPITMDARISSASNFKFAVAEYKQKRYTPGKVVLVTTIIFGMHGMESVNE